MFRIGLGGNPERSPHARVEVWQKWEPIEEIATSCEHKYHILEESYDIDIRCERCGKCGGADEMNAQLNAYRQRIDELEGLLNAFHEVVHKAMGKRQEGSSDE